MLVNNAGYGLPGVLELVPVEEAQALFDVNLWGVVRMIQAVMPHMRAQGTPTLKQAEQFVREQEQEKEKAGGTGSGAAGASVKKGGYIINLSSTSGLRGR